MRYIIKCDGVLLAKFNPATGESGFIVTTSEQAAIHICKQLDGLLGKMSYKECEDDKVAEAMGLKTPSQMESNDYFIKNGQKSFKEEPEDPYKNVKLPSEGKTLFNLPINKKDNPEVFGEQ